MSVDRLSAPSSPPLPLTHESRRVQGNPPLPTFPPPSMLPPSYHSTIFSFPFSHNLLASTIAPLTVSRLFSKQFFPSLPLGFLSTSSTSSPKFSSPSLFGCSLPSLFLAAASAGAPLLYSRPPLPPSVSSDPTWFLPSSPSLPSVSSSGTPVLNLDPSGAPLTFKSALSLWSLSFPVASRQRHRIGEAGRDHSYSLPCAFLLLLSHLF